MILAERLCLLGFDVRGGKQRELPSSAILANSLSILTLADLLAQGRFRADATSLIQCDALPLAHPLLREATTAVVSRESNSIKDAIARLQRSTRHWWPRLLRSLAERDILEVQIPFPFMRRYCLRSRQAWHESIDRVRELRHSPSLASTSLIFAAQRCGWLDELLNPDEAHACLLVASDFARKNTSAELIQHAMASA